MTNSDLNRYRSVLEAKQAELVRLLRNRDGIAIEKCPDALDEVQHATERELVVRNLDRDSNLLRNVRGALRLIAEGDFGVCVQCEEDVSPKRLAAVPWTPFCIRCQEIADRSQGGSADYLDTLLGNVPARSYHGATEFMQPCPGGLIFLQTEDSLQSQSAGAVLLGGHPPHRAEPDRQRSPGVLEDRSCCH